MATIEDRLPPTLAARNPEIHAEEPGERKTDDMTAQGLDLAASLIRELLIDLFGSLVPGFLFTMFAVPMVIWVGAILLDDVPSTRTGLGLLAHAPISILFTVVVVVSYVVGHVFSRCDPKIPDRKSLAYILRKDWTDLDRAMVQPRGQDKESRRRIDLDARKKSRLRRCVHWYRVRSFTRTLARGNGSQFPYSHLRVYLQRRGLEHLATRVPWSGEEITNEETISMDIRSKHFINVLKIRLQYFNPRRCGDIIRNEAHVRMMSSVWYAARLLQYVYTGLLVLVLSEAYLRGQWKLPLHILPQFPRAVLLTLIALFVSIVTLRKMVVHFLHYQRGREIVYVLETAYQAFLNGAGRIFEGFDDRQSRPVPSGQSAKTIQDVREEEGPGAQTAFQS